MLSRERQADGWQPTDLVQESYLRLLDWRVVRWQNRAHFFATTAKMMRRAPGGGPRGPRAPPLGRGVCAAAPRRRGAPGGGALVGGRLRGSRVARPAGGARR